MNTKKITLYAMIASVYTVSSIVLGTFAYGQIQFRFAEIMCILAIRDKKYILPLTLGCFVTNLIGLLSGVNPLVLDVFLGTLATFIACYLMYELRNILIFNRPILALLMPALINGLIIGAELSWLFYPSNFILGFLINGFWVFLSEFIIVTIFGAIFYQFLFKLIDNVKIGV